MAVDPLSVSLPVINVTEKLFTIVRDITITHRVARAEIQELLDQLRSWVSKLKNMTQVVNVSLLTDADNDEWYNTFYTVNDSLMKLNRIMGKRSHWIVLKFGFGRSEEVQGIGSSVQKRIEILEGIHRRTCERYARANMALRCPLVLMGPAQEEYS